jgi:hypothetical protein
VVRVFVTKAFRRFQRKEQIDDAALCEAIARAELGIIDAELGRGLIKQRVARKGQGRSGGYRTIIAYRTAERSVFLFGFAKSRQSNLGVADERDLADYGAMLLSLDEDGIEIMLAGDELKEIGCP